MSDGKTIRLECICCDRSDYDGITPAELRKLRKTWHEIERVQTYAQACRPYTPEQVNRSRGRLSILDWSTHQGTCPECHAAEEARVQRRKANHAQA